MNRIQQPVFQVTTSSVVTSPSSCNSYQSEGPADENWNPLTK